MIVRERNDDDGRKLFFFRFSGPPQARSWLGTTQSTAHGAQSRALAESRGDWELDESGDGADRGEGGVYCCSVPLDCGDLRSWMWCTGTLEQPSVDNIAHGSGSPDAVATN